jgi:hypothetical protein
MSSSAKADDLVFNKVEVALRKTVLKAITGCSAFAEHDMT